MSEPRKHTPGLLEVVAHLAEDNFWQISQVDGGPHPHRGSMFIEPCVPDDSPDEDAPDHDIPEAEMEANVDRFVACWNACQGITTEALEGGVVKELLEACEGIEAALLPYRGPDTSPEKAYIVSREAVRAVRAAISKAMPPKESPDADTP